MRRRRSRSRFRSSELFGVLSGGVIGELIELGEDKLVLRKHVRRGGIGIGKLFSARIDLRGTFGSNATVPARRQAERRRGVRRR